MVRLIGLDWLELLSWKRKQERVRHHRSVNRVHGPIFLPPLPCNLNHFNFEGDRRPSLNILNSEYTDNCMREKKCGSKMTLILTCPFPVEDEMPASFA